MDAPLHCEMHKRGSEKSEGQLFKKSRNSNRRKCKNTEIIKDIDYKEKIRELTNFFLSNPKGTALLDKTRQEDKNTPSTSNNENLVPCKKLSQESSINNLQEKLMHNRIDNNYTPCDYNIKTHMMKEVKKPRKNRGKPLQKQVQGSKEWNGKNLVIINSSLNAKGKIQKNGNGGRRRNENFVSNSLEKTKVLATDKKFPEYLTQEEMDCISKFGILRSGLIRINQKNCSEAYISAPDKGMDILITGLIDRNRALEGDEVYYVLKGEEHYRTNSDTGEMQRTAAVVAIKNAHHCRGAIGTVNLQSGHSGAILFSPRDHRIPKMLISKTNLPRWFPQKAIASGIKQLFYVKIYNWDDVKYAEGELIGQIGHVGDIESETTAILIMLELDAKPYPDSLMTYLPTLPYIISDEDLTHRRDFRNACIYTIDPASAKDLDDAVSCRRLPNGNYEIGVHISDVSHFLSEGSPLDDAIAKKATTIYMVQKVYHMLPLELCELCSLIPGEDRLAFSVVWEMTPDFEIVTHNFTRSIINSCGKFSYDQIQEILEESENPSLPKLQGEHNIQEVIDSVKILNRIAIELRKKRFENGALRIDQTKIVFSLDQSGFPLNYQVYINKEAHRLIEEFMLLANITVAQRINLHFPKIAFLRCHSPPQSYMMKRLQENLKKYGIHLDISSSKSLYSSLIKYNGRDIQSIAKMIVLNSFLAKPMNRAKYFCAGISSADDDKKHYALNVPLYTHFTSPIRRYADVIVHRLLAASLGYSKIPNWTPEQVKKIAENCNKKKYAAKLASEKSTELYFNLYILKVGSLICHGAVSDIKEKFFTCILFENGTHHRVHLSRRKASSRMENKNGISRIIVTWWETDDKRKSVQVIELFSIVKVELKKNKWEKEITAHLIRSD